MQQILFQYSPAADDQSHTAGTVPANKQWILHSLTVTNLVKEDLGDTYKGVKYKLHIIKSGESPDAKNCLAYYPAYLPGQSVHRYEGIRLNAGDYIAIYLTSGRLAVQGFGEEIDADVETKYKQSLDSVIAMGPDVDSMRGSLTTIAGCVCP